MNKLVCVCLALFVLQCSIPGNCLEPVTGFTAGIAAIGSLIYTGYEAIHCRITSCCNERWIKGNITGLEHALAEKLYGQHLVEKTVVGHIKGHLRSSSPQKALVLSFHGLTGVGKNYVSRIIAENLYREGFHSKYVHLIAATKEFPHEGMVPFYKDQLKSWIEGNVSLCERSLFIFDEVDKLPALLLDVIKPYLDHYEHLGGINYRKAIFLFLSNTGGIDIGKYLFEHWKNGKKREALELREVENLIMLSAVNADNHNGLWHSQLISNHLITAYIPFLPLEKRHVRDCVKDALIAKKYYKKREEIQSDIVERVMEELKYYPETVQLFSSTGCKRVAEKIDLVMIEEENKKRKKRIEL